MSFKSIILVIFFNISLFAHGIFYEVNDGAISIRITAPNNIAISNAKVKIYAPSGSLAYTKGQTDVNGNFAFMPDSKGKWKVKVSVPSDHGNHEKEFNIDISDDYKIKDFDKTPAERYISILSALGIIFGIFGLLSLYLRKKEAKK